MLPATHLQCGSQTADSNERTTMSLRGIAACIGLGAALLTAQLRTPDQTIQYRPGDWTTWPMMRHASSVDLDERMVYVATTGGIGRYDYYRNEWGAPITGADGLTGHSVSAIAVDPSSGYLWAKRIAIDPPIEWPITVRF